MSWRFLSHRRFQREAAVLVAVGGGIGALAWALPLAGAAWWTATGIGPLVAGLAGRQAHLPPRRSLPLVAAVAVAAAALAGLTWQALAVPLPALDLGDAVMAGGLAGLAASPALAAAYLERIVVRPLERAIAEARAMSAGDERALAERAAAAHDRIALGLAGDAGTDSRRLGHLAEEVTLQVIGLARRCRSLRGEVERIDVPAVRRRAGALAEAATGSSDEAARADLTRAARAVVALDERAQALAGTAARVRARLELQVAMLEETALAVAARQACAAAGEADAFAPLADRLHEAGRDLADQAQALTEAGSAALVKSVS